MAYSFIISPRNQGLTQELRHMKCVSRYDKKIEFRSRTSCSIEELDTRLSTAQLPQSEHRHAHKQASKHTDHVIPYIQVLPHPSAHAIQASTQASTRPNILNQQHSAFPQTPLQTVPHKISIGDDLLPQIVKVLLLLSWIMMVVV